MEGNLIDKWTSTNEKHTIEGLEVGKTFKLVEKIAPDTFVVASEIEFTVESIEEIQKVHMIDKQVKVSKTDITGENELEGAELEIQDMQGNVIDKWVSGNEPHYVSGLTEGQTFKLIENIAPNTFVLASEIEFTVSFDKETQLIHMVDKQLVVSKTDLVTGEELERC